MSEKEIKTVFKKDLIIKGALWFALITIVTIAAIFFYNNTGNAIQALKSIKPAYIFLLYHVIYRSDAWELEKSYFYT